MSEFNVPEIWNKAEREKPGHYNDIKKFLAIGNTARPTDYAVLPKLVMEARDRAIKVESRGGETFRMPSFSFDEAERVRNLFFVLAHQDYNCSQFFGDLDFSDLNFIPAAQRGKWRLAYMRTASGWRMMLEPTFRAKDRTFKELGLEPEQVTAFETAFDDGYGLLVIGGGVGSGRTSLVNSLAGHLVVENKKTVFEITRDTAAKNADWTQLVQRENDTTGAVWTHALQFQPEVIVCRELRTEVDAAKACEAAMAGALVIAGLHAANPANALERLLAMTPTADALAEALRLIAVVSTLDVFETVEKKKRKSGNRMITEVVPISAKSQSNLRRTGNHAKLIDLIKEKEGYLSVSEIVARLEKQGLESTNLM